MKFISNAMIDAAIGTCNAVSTSGCGKYRCTVEVMKSLINYPVDDFFSYMVSDPKIGAEIDVRIKSRRVTDSEKSCEVIHKDALLFSGGIDSFCAYRRLEGIDILPIFFNYGEQYNALEWEFAQKFCHVTFDLELEKRLNCWDYIIPMRNFIFVAIAARYANNVYLAATAGDLTDRDPDKSVQFFTDASAILSKYYDREIQIKTPFGNKTKSEIVRDYLDSGYNTDALKSAVTCYNGISGDKLCGICGACFRRACAFKNSEIHDPDEYKVDPLVSQRDEYLARCMEGKYSRRRVNEITSALEVK